MDEAYQQKRQQFTEAIDRFKDLVSKLLDVIGTLLEYTKENPVSHAHSLMLSIYEKINNVDDEIDIVRVLWERGL